MKILFYISIFFLSFRLVYGQECGEKFIKNATKEFNKKNSFRQKASISFDIAKCYKGKNDSMYWYWLTQTIENYNQDYGHSSHSQLAIALYQTGYAYFELKDFKASETYFNKSIRCNKTLIPPVLDSTVYLYYGISLYHNKNFNDAVEILKIYKKTHPTNNIADKYIEKCINPK